MSKSLSMFVEQLSSLGGELSDMYPSDVDIRMAKNSIEALKTMNPKLLYDNFVNFIYPYKNEILSKNENFFINMDYSEKIKAQGADQNKMMTVMNLKKYWGNMSDSTKECMWQYFTVLVMLCDKIKAGK